MFQSKQVIDLTCHEVLEPTPKKPKYMQNIIVDEVEMTELKYILGIPHIHSFEQWQKEQEELNKIIPAFVAESEGDKIMSMFDEIIDEHKCSSCFVLLCCNNYMFHDANCWALELKSTITLQDIRKIYTYRVDVLTGAMIGWEDYAYAPFEETKHFSLPFAAHHVGFFVRCFQCKECSKVDHKGCHAMYHHHH